MPQPLRILCVQPKYHDRKAITGSSSFVDEFNFVDHHGLKAEPNLELNTTAYWMRQRFGVSPLFFSCFYSPKYVVKIGNASLIRTKGGKRVALGKDFCNIRSTVLTVWILDGIYRFSSGLGAPVTHVWFSHSLIEGQSSTYKVSRRHPQSTKSRARYFMWIYKEINFRLQDISSLWVWSRISVNRMSS